MAIVRTDDKHYKAIADAIRNQPGYTDNYTPEQMPSAIISAIIDAKAEGMGAGYDDGYTLGKQARYDEFWDNFQQNGNRTNYVCGFSGMGWNKENFNPKYTPITFPNKNSFYEAREIFKYFGTRNYDKLETIGIDLTPDIVDFSNARNVGNAFYGAAFRSVTADISNATSLGGMFGGNDGGSVLYITLTTSENTGDFVSTVFSHQTNLKELIFTVGNCKVLAF